MPKTPRAAIRNTKTNAHVSIDGSILHVDRCTKSGHRLHGPIGIGQLWVLGHSGECQFLDLRWQDWDVRGRVSGLPVERYIGLEHGMGLPVMVCRDQGNRHWITDGTRSALIFPPERDVDEVDSKRYSFEYSIDRAEELLSTVDPIIREDFPYDEWVHANWLQLTVFQLLSEYPRGFLEVDRMSLQHDSLDSSGQLQIKIQGTEKLFRVRRLRPRRRGRMLIEIYVQPDASVTLTARQATLGLVTRNTWQPDPREIQGQARQVVDVALEFMWECVEIDK